MSAFAMPSRYTDVACAALSAVPIGTVPTPSTPTLLAAVEPAGPSPEATPSMPAAIAAAPATRSTTSAALRLPDMARRLLPAAELGRCSGRLSLDALATGAAAIAARSEEH